MSHQPDSPFGCSRNWGPPIPPYELLHICNLLKDHSEPHECKCGETVSPDVDPAVEVKRRVPMVILCEETLREPVNGECPVHGGDACLFGYFHLREIYPYGSPIDWAVVPIAEQDELVAALRDARRMIGEFFCGDPLREWTGAPRLARIDAVLTRHDNRDNEKEEQ